MEGRQHGVVALDVIYYIGYSCMQEARVGYRHEGLTFLGNESCRLEGQRIRFERHQGVIERDDACQQKGCAVVTAGAVQKAYPESSGVTLLCACMHARLVRLVPSPYPHLLPYQSLPAGVRTCTTDPRMEVASTTLTAPSMRSTSSPPKPFWSW